MAGNLPSIFKNRIAVILGLICCILVVITVNSCLEVSKHRNARQQEMAVRLDAEENLNKITKDKTACQLKASEISKQLEEQKSAFESNKKALVQEQLINQSLKEELAKVTRVKEALEQELKDALTQASKAVEQKSTK
ncbi:MAG: hypothetical protein MUF05_05860 [Candidatus Omnitrophica bacterium]|jgi:hypothetical protein|nr:hypothetical protein [Candidatus Omnitrophota bacterium]